LLEVRVKASRANGTEAVITAMKSKTSIRTVAALGTAQTLAWASSYYLPAMLAKPMSHDLGVTAPTVFAAFSIALLVSAVLGPFAGRSIDLWGGRPVLIATNLIFAIGLAGLAMAQGVAGLFIAWLVIGIGMGSGLYEAAFAALVRLRGHDARGAITGITLIAGFASTVGWPLTTWLDAELGWRGACLVWAALHLVVGIPLNACVPAASPRSVAPVIATITDVRREAEPLSSNRNRRRAEWLLAFVFATTWFISTAMAAHLPRLMQAAGTSLAIAVSVGALVGPAQVVARILEYSALRRSHPLLSARIASLMHPLGAAVLMIFGAPVAALFAILHGAGNGILTIAKGTLPLALFGPDGYGHRQGVLMVPARIAQALAPWLFGVLLDRWSAHALWFSAGLGVLAFAALLLLPKRFDAQQPSSLEVERVAV
jgi:predicted MFS family arabinose efflux permease